MDPRASGFDVSVDFVEWGILGILPGKQEALPSAGHTGLSAPAQSQSVQRLSGTASKQCLLGSQLQGVQISLLLQDHTAAAAGVPVWSGCKPHFLQTPTGWCEGLSCFCSET